MTSLRVKETLNEASNILKENRIESYLLDAKILFLFALKKEDVFLITNLDSFITKEEYDKYMSLINKRKTHMPISYITNNKEFMGLNFYVNKDVLIPRPDSELLVTYIIDNFKDKKNLEILELGVGSGCLSLSLAKFLDKVNILGADICAKALFVANENLKRLNLKNVTFIESDLFENIKNKKFDIILSNPPYIKKEEYENLDKTVYDYEPKLALFSKDNGLYFYKKIINEAKSYLKKGALLIFEIGYNQAKDVYTLLEENGFKNIEILKDLNGCDRVILAKNV